MYLLLPHLKGSLYVAGFKEKAAKAAQQAYESTVQATAQVG